MKTKARTIVEWLNLVQHLIAKHSTPPRTRGKYKGHGDTEPLLWIAELARECELYIKRRNNYRRNYDGNMAIASLMGVILSAWYAQVHRAKGMDPVRPKSRRKVFTQLNKWRARLITATTDERIMVQVFSGQQWNLPFGRGAKGGTFV